MNSRLPRPAHGITMEFDGNLAKGVTRPLEKIGWLGRVDRQLIVSNDGIPRLIDFNGRAYQTIALALGVGVNFMGVWSRVATNRKPTIPQSVQLGIRYQYLMRDLFRVHDEHG